MKNSDELAYPHTEIDTFQGIEVMNNHFGLTKREVFAVAAMQGMIASGICTPPQDETIHHMTSMASVSYADALLAELEK